MATIDEMAGNKMNIVIETMLKLKINDEDSCKQFEGCPLDSVCGLAMLEICMRAWDLKNICDPATHDAINQAAYHACEIILFG